MLARRPFHSPRRFGRVLGLSRGPRSRFGIFAVTTLLLALGASSSLAALDGATVSRTGKASSPPPLLEGWVDSLEAAVEELEARTRAGSSPLLLVDMYADWCGWCKTLEREVFDTVAFRRYAKAENLVLLRVDTEDGGEGTYLQARHGGGSLPTTLLLDPSLVRVGRIRGFAPTVQFLERLEAERAAWVAITQNFARVAAEGAPDLQRKLAEDFHERGDGVRAAALYEAVLRRVQPKTEAAAWLEYLLADAYRIGREFDDAREQLKVARGALAAFSTSQRDPAASHTATEPSDEATTDRAASIAELSEKLDLLGFYIEQDDGDCPRAVASLERFLTEHPASPIVPSLRSTLAQLQADEHCT